MKSKKKMNKTLSNFKCLIPSKKKQTIRDKNFNFVKPKKKNVARNF